jgi:ACT domain-containing protein
MIYVDTAIRWKIRGKKWCHMISDTAEEELHEFAKKIGLKRSWFHRGKDNSKPHYDLTEDRRRRAIQLGAKAVGRREFVDILIGNENGERK